MLKYCTILKKGKKSILKTKNQQDWFVVLSQTADTTGYITSAGRKRMTRAFPLFCLGHFFIYILQVYIVSTKKKSP